MFRAQSWLFAVALVAAGGLLHAQQPQPSPQRPVFRAGVDLVQIDVVVLDANGEPVHGLTKDDFTLLDRDTTQPIAAFSEVAHTRPPAKIFPAGFPLDVATNQTAKSDRLVMIVIDDLHFRGRTDEVKALVRQVVDGIEGGASIGIAATSGAFAVEVTDDRERLLLAINAFVDRFDPHRAGAELQPVIGVNAAGDPIINPGPHDMPSSFSETNTYKTVENVAKMMGANDGRRKAIVWISGGVEGAGLAGVALHTPKDGLDPCFAIPGPSASETLGAVAGPVWSCGAVNSLFEKLHQSSVAVYSVDPGGPADKGQSLRRIAVESGGFAVAANDLDAGMQRLLADLDNYYLLGFYPTDPKDKHYRPIEVRVDRPGVTVRYRRGYQPGGPPPPPRNDSPLERLVAPVMPNTDLPLRLGAVPLLGAGDKVHVLVTLEVGVDTVLPDAATRAPDSVEYAVYAADLNRKKVTASDSRRVDVQWPVDTGHAAGTFRVQSVLTLAPGPYQLRASATSKTLDKSGSVYLQIDVPDTKDDALAIGGLVVDSNRPDNEQPTVMHAATIPGLTLPFAPSLTRVFNDGDDVRVFFQVRRLTGATPIAGTIAIVGEDGHETMSQPWTLAANAAPAVELRLPIAGIQAGPYRLVVTASDGQRQAKKELAIRVE